ncbi:MAG: hypothetical protein WA740_10100 [Candidatus Binataceae bacterium]
MIELRDAQLPAVMVFQEDIGRTIDRAFATVLKSGFLAQAMQCSTRCSRAISASSSFPGSSAASSLSYATAVTESTL